MANSATTFQPGDVVQLKSGGALMTVTSEETDGVWVYYSDVQGLPVSRSYALPAIVLKKVEPEIKRKAGGSVVVI